MTVRQFPQSGEVIAKRVQDQGGADLHGSVLIARRGEPHPLPDPPRQAGEGSEGAANLGNVIPFVRPHRNSLAAPFPLPSIAADERPAPWNTKVWPGASIAFFTASLVLHGVLAVMFWHQPKTMPSVGVESLRVDIVLGATEAAGTAPSPGEREAQPAPPSEQPQDEPVTEQQSRVATVMPQEVPVAAQETAPEVKQVETPPEAQAVEPTPQEQRAETMLAEAPAVTQPAEQTEQPRPQVQAVQEAPERNRIAAHIEKKAAQNKQVAATVPSNPASSVGVGSSAKLADYRALVAGHLQRHKQYPAGARGEGRAVVSFSVDGSGRVTSSQVVGSSGNPAFDREVVAMARRASPFPRPPDGKGQNFTVSVRFEEPRR
ncbi:MAG: energy transducer TonB [Xanthobacteraceae bacterium]|nr:energy transducer TonB [Xanthobacteraceae bacterium]